MIVHNWSDFQLIKEEVYAMDHQCFDSGGWSEESWKGLFSHHSLKLLTEHNVEELLGFMVITTVEKESEILRLAVGKKHRRKGVARLLLARTEKFMTCKGIELVHLEVREDNWSAISFYKSMGFKLVGNRRQYYKNPLSDALLFSKPINS